MELVKDFVEKTLPSLRIEVVDSLMDRLEVVGVRGVNDLSFVTPKDLDGILRPIQCRRLIKAFIEDSQAASGPVSTPLPQDNILHLTPPATPVPIVHALSRVKYSVPWHKMPPNLLAALNEKKKAPPKERREMVRVVIDDLLSKDPGRAGRAKLREIARQIVERYPCSFQDSIGTGYDGVFIQLENRLENVKRRSAVCLKKRLTADKGEEAPKKKSRNSVWYGCVEWGPAIVGREELQAKQAELKSAFKTQHLRESAVRKLMTETYSIQRETINNGGSISIIMEEWPFLFKPVHLFDHTSTLLGFLVQTKLEEEVSRKARSIRKFFDSIGMKIGEDPVQLFSGIARHFKEDPHHLFYPKKDSADCNVALPSTPCILITGDQQFKIVVDQEIVSDHITTPTAALSYAFSLFYVCNIRYPKEISLTLEFIQRVFLGINPDRGSKAEMKGKHIPPRLLKFLNDLNSFENPWRI